MTTQQSRLFAAVAAQAIVLAISGCHKQPATAAAQPAPPYPPTTTARSSNPARSPRATPQTPPKSAAIPPPLPPPEAHGKPVLTETGLASWYGPPYTNRHAADGSVYDQNAMTAAHRTLPMGSIVRVTNLANNESAVVRITDRGPFVDGRIIDLSLAAAKATGLYRMGVAKVRVEAFAPPVRPGVDPAGHWCVQIGAFLDPADATQLKNDLIRRYATAKVIEFPGPTGHWVRINARNPDKATADQIANSIHIPDPGAQPYVVRLN